MTVTPLIDTTTPKGRLIAAALKLAEERAWGDITLLDIAEKAEMPLDEVRRAFGAKSQILAAFMRAVDDQVLKAAAQRQADQPKRDQLFEIVMSRFDVLEPYRTALKSIAKASPSDTSLIMPFLNAQRWMLTAAGIDGDGPLGLVRTVGMGSIYASVFQTWLADDDPGAARTMAALDRRLRRAESTIRSVDNACDGVSRIARDAPAVMSSMFGAIFRRPDVRPEAGDVPPAADKPLG